MAASFTRRDFLRHGGFTVALAASMTASPLRAITRDAAAFEQSLPDGGRRQRVLLFHDPSFPTIDSAAYAREALLRALQHTDVRTVSADGLATALREGGVDLVITAHGSAFPEDAGMALLGYLARAGNWLQLGGVPLAVPVRRGAKGWEAAPRRTRWHRKLGMTQSFPVDAAGIRVWRASECCPDLAAATASLSDTTVHALYWRLSSTKYFPGEDGSAGTRDAVLRSLVDGLGEEDTPVVSLVQQLDWLHGDYAGGRWILCTGSASVPEDLLGRLASLAGCGATECVVSPGFARYRPGEAPELRVLLRRPSRDSEVEGRLEVLADGQVVFGTTLQLRTAKALPYTEAIIPLTSLPESTGHAATVAGARPARWYEIRLQATCTCAGGLTTVSARSGFFVAEDEALHAGTPIRREGAALFRGDAPFVAAGTSYMAGDVQRNFLLEPNAAVWRDDFAAMRAAGINLLRTGIWFGWKRMMLEPGRIDESALRAMDAFLLVAIEYDIPVIFSFFAFLPEAWGGENPYLDPRAVTAQKAFVAAFARRHAGVPGLVWDLINEPSFSSPAQLWRCRPNYDRHEREAWHDWLRGRVPGSDDMQRLAALRDRWRGDAGEDASLPTLAEFDDGNLFSDRQPLKVLDYRLFAQDAFAGWVRALSAAIRVVDRPDRLIMVGQDEGGTMDRPNPQFFARDVDITSVHSWWFNDDLLWDSVVTRAPGRPHLVQETGAMFYERSDGTPWRSETESALLVMRKLAIAAGTGSDGYVQWLWNTNPYMPSDNEAAIGALRADDSAKPELFVLRKMSRFLARIAPSLAGRIEEDVLLVLPHADQFSVRGNGMRATRAAVRTMAYRCRVPLRAVSEYRLADAAPARLYLLPSPAVLGREAWDQLLARVQAGATLLVTGVLDRDEFWLPVSRSELFGVTTGITPVAREEMLEVGDRKISTGFRGEDLQRVERAVLSDGRGGTLRETRHGKGHILWCPVPAEMGDSEAATEMLYDAALDRARVVSPVRLRPSTPGVLAWVTQYRSAALLTLVSEVSEDLDVRISLRDPDAQTETALPAGSAVLMLFDRNGRLLDRSDRE